MPQLQFSTSGIKVRSTLFLVLALGVVAINTSSLFWFHQGLCRLRPQGGFIVPLFIYLSPSQTVTYAYPSPSTPSAATALIHVAVGASVELVRQRQLALCILCRPPVSRRVLME